MIRIIARLNIGGPAIHAVLLTEGLDKARFETLLTCGSISDKEGDMSYYASEHNISPVFIPELKREINFRDDLTAFIKILRFINIEKPDIIHTHTAKAGTIGRMAAVAFKLNNLFSPTSLKIVHTFHGHVFDGYFGAIKTRIFILIERMLSLFTDQIFTVSESVKNELILLGIAKNNKIIVMPLGFELDKFLRLPLSDNPDLNIGIVGRLVSIKNHRLFLELAKKVINDNPTFKLNFMIIGDGELRDELQKYANALDLEERVVFLGWKKDLEQVYSELEIVVSTSLNEGTPVSLIEAMASARPVVATDVGGVADLLGKGLANIEQNKFKLMERGILVKSGDLDGFAAALSFLISNKGLAKDMGINGRRFAQDKFSKDRLITDVENQYLNILGRRSYAC